MEWWCPAFTQISFMFTNTIILVFGEFKTMSMRKTSWDQIFALEHVSLSCRMFVISTKDKDTRQVLTDSLNAEKVWRNEATCPGLQMVKQTGLDPEPAAQVHWAAVGPVIRHLECSVTFVSFTLLQAANSSYHCIAHEVGARNSWQDMTGCRWLHKLKTILLIPRTESKLLKTEDEVLKWWFRWCNMFSVTRTRRVSKEWAVTWRAVMWREVPELRPQRWVLVRSLVIGRRLHQQQVLSQTGTHTFNINTWFIGFNCNLSLQNKPLTK